MLLSASATYCPNSASRTRSSLSLVAHEAWAWSRSRPCSRPAPKVRFPIVKATFDNFADSNSVWAIDRLESPESDPTSDFAKISKRAREELGTSLAYRQVDVRNSAELNKIFEDVAEQTGRLDGLIAAAGINQETPALEYTAEDADRMMSINFTGCFMTAQAAARQMVRLKTPGSICLIASMSGALPSTIASPLTQTRVYNPSKAAVVQLGRSLASEWGQYGIRVNTLSPGYILTQMLQNLFDDYPERQTKWAGENMLGRISSPQEFRGAAVFLLSDASSFMTGSDLRIDGGHTAW
ncbi:putative Short chain dehydrogenase [Ilyonectria robusta]